jgi:hypothetical protein
MRHSSHEFPSSLKNSLTQLSNDASSSEAPHRHSLSHRLHRSSTISYREDSRHASLVEGRVSYDRVLCINIEPELLSGKAVQLRSWCRDLLKDVRLCAIPGSARGAHHERFTPCISIVETNNDLRVIRMLSLQRHDSSWFDRHAFAIENRSDLPSHALISIGVHHDLPR